VTAPIGYPDRFGALQSSQLESSQKTLGTKATEGKEGAAFAETLQKFVSEVDGTQKTAEAKSTAFAEGRSDDIHGTMVSVQQAEITLHLLANVRNRVLDMYREVMRMGS